MRLKTIVIVIAMLIMVGVGYGYYLYTKPRVLPSQMQSTASISAVALYNTYLNDSATANKQYTGKVIEVYGSVGTIDTSNSNIAINMKTDTISNGVISCSMEKGTNMLKEMQGVKLGDSIRVKGLCTGYIDFASQVNINEGFIVK